MKAKEQSIIDHLKKVKDEKQLTFQEIANITEANGEAVSLSCIKKVFSPNDPHVHDYRRTIRPIARAILGEVDDEVTGSYQAINEYKEFIIEQQELQIKLLLEQKEASSKKHKDREAFFIDQLAFYKEQIMFKDSQIKRLNEAIDRKDRMIRERLIEE